MENNSYFLGLDMGTSSVGWAVTDSSYRLKRFRKNLMWGVSLFDEAQHADGRRFSRTGRRRYGRRKQRIKLLQDFFAPEILAKDAKFFMRLKESTLFPEDSSSRTKNIFFDDDDYGDKEYYKQYPTIHHLIYELMYDPKPHDVRLVYLACAYILSHRGHFLSEVDKNKVDDVLDFNNVYKSFYDHLCDFCDCMPFEYTPDAFKNILLMGGSVTNKEKNFKGLLFNGNRPVENEDIPIDLNMLLKFISGSKSVKVSELFKKEEYSDLEPQTVCVKDASFSENIEMLSSRLEADESCLLEKVKALYDWSLLNDILKYCGDEETEKRCISLAKIKIYEKHKKDLGSLKGILRKYAPCSVYDDVFRNVSKNSKNYAVYARNLRSVRFTEEIKKFESCSQEDFCKFILNCLKNITPEPCDKEDYDYLNNECEQKTLCPKQVSNDNRVIPYQLYYAELKAILKNAENYLPFLKGSDTYGSVSDKILKIMEFRIPYYVGSLVDTSKSKNAWMVRKNDGKIYPWNFDDKVDHEASEAEFIKRMLNRCTYIADEYVLPKNSLLYSKFEVLNAINKIAVNGEPITVEEKQYIYEKLFIEQKRKVTVKRVAETLKRFGRPIEITDKISGIDDTVKATLKSYHDFKNLIHSGILSEIDVEDIIEHLTITTDKKRFKNWLKDNYALSDKDIDYVSGLKYSDYGRLSRFLLEEVFESDKDTDERSSDRNIINALWETNENLMQLLGEKHGYSTTIEKINAEYYAGAPQSIEARLKEMYVSPAAIRSIIRTVEIVKEIKSIMKKAPDKIFVEMARGSDEENKGKRTRSRRDSINALFAAAKDIINAEELTELKNELAQTSDNALQSKKCYLYFTQLGRCLYSGKPINFEELSSDKYNIDHIYPQSKTKDDSLDNMALVLSELNGEKGDAYPINKDIRNKMSGFWYKLSKNGLISSVKYTRLVRKTPLSAEELAGFISRQLVETRQSTKAAAAILKELFPKTKIVYVKAKWAKEMRDKMFLPKCRELNDIHHAKDAYLNIVAGNVINAVFTDNVQQFVETGENYSLKLFDEKDGKQSGMLAHKIVKHGKTIWDRERSFDIVRRVMAKSSVRYVRYTYKEMGMLFDINPLRAGYGQIGRKSGKNALPISDISKYGGYNNAKISFFGLVKYADKGAVLIPVRLIEAEKYLNDESFARCYAADIIGEWNKKEVSADDIRLERVINKNTMFELDGYRINITGRSDNRFLFVSAMTLVLPRKVTFSDGKSYDPEWYIKRIVKLAEKIKANKNYVPTSFDKVNKEDNMIIFDILSDKCTSRPFEMFFGSFGKKFKEERNSFFGRTVQEQVGILGEIIKLLKTGNANGADLSKIGGNTTSGKLKKGMMLFKNKDFKEIYIIDQSPTGLYEKKSVNLLEL